MRWRSERGRQKLRDGKEVKSGGQSSPKIRPAAAAIAPAKSTGASPSLLRSTMGWTHSVSAS